MPHREPNRFQFANAGSDSNLTVLNAVMADFSYADHAHEEVSLGVTLEGLQEFSCNGSRFLSPPGGIILFNPGDVHNGNPGSRDPLKYTMLYLGPQDFYPLMGSAAGVDRAEFRMTETNFRDNVLKALILRMSRLVNDAGRSRLEREHCLYGIAEQLARRAGVYVPAAWAATKDTLLLRAGEYIRDNLARDITIDDLSRVAGISKYHFIRLFRSQFGLTPHRYILNLRINRAKEALERGVPPSEAAQDFGFFDVSHLNRHFKRAYGLAPGKYQRQLTP